MLDKIAEGTVQKYLKDVTLLGQVFVKAADGKQTIEQLLKEKGASVAGFTLFMVGEGIEKRLTTSRLKSPLRLPLLLPRSN
jgi:elongation factor Ts